jgi:hypothetical protein
LKPASAYHRHVVFKIRARRDGYEASLFLPKTPFQECPTQLIAGGRTPETALRAAVELLVESRGLHDLPADPTGPRPSRRRRSPPHIFKEPRP